MKTIFILLISSISLFSCSTKIGKNNIEKGKVLLSEETHSYETEDNRLKKDVIQSKIYTEGKIINYKSEDIYEYNSVKDLIIINSYDIENNKRILRQTTYKNPTYIEKIYFGDKSDTTKHIKDFFKKGLVVKSIKNLTFITGEKIQEIAINQYNENRELIKKDIYDLNNNFIRSHTYTYKKSGNIIEIENKNNKGEVVQNTKQQLKNDTILFESWEIPNISIDTVYYLKNQVIKEVSISLSPRKETIFENKYDKNGRLIERKEYVII
ncbi:MAG: hypothetical protein HXX18_13815 [Bacteroidetes bacterium]|nr:hypothetical protein [Bacteroidota bacterium]